MIQCGVTIWAHSAKKNHDELAWDHGAASLLSAYKKLFNLRHSPKPDR